MSKPFLAVAIAAAAACVVLVACGKKEPAAPPASVVDLMKDTIAPTADVLWQAVGSEATAEGTKDIAPATQAEWAALREKAQGLAMAADQIAEESRPVAHPGQTLKDPPGPGDLTPEQSQAAIAKDRATYVAFAASMKAAANAFVAAIDKKDLDAYSNSGGTLDEVCEACHKRFWYPEAPTPPAP